MFDDMGDFFVLGFDEASVAGGILRAKAADADL